MMRRAFALAGLTAAFCFAFAPVAQAAGTQTRTCPLPVVGGDPDVVALSGPTGTPATWTVTADESPGEASHLVSLTLVATPDGGIGQSQVVTGAGFSPVALNLSLAPGHHYTVQWVATFDFGVHPCSSLLPGQSAFGVDT
jgi:hypothetical protein